MERRGFLRLLGSCFPLVLAFLTAAVLAAPAGSLAAPAGPALGTDRAASAAMTVSQWGLTVTASSQRGQAAAVHLQSDQPAAFPVATVASPPAAIAAAPRALRDTGSRAPAAPRGPPHLSA